MNATGSPAPALPSLRSPMLPLEGLRVADFSWVHAGPFGAMLLAEMGAEVIKIETHKRLDIVRRLPPMADRDFGINRSGYFNSVNRAKRSCTLDLSKPDSIVLAKQVIATCDVVIENYSAGVMDRLGLGYEALRAVAPDIIMISISGYGATGPDRSYVAYGPPLTAYSGLVHATGYPGGEPQPAGIAWPDPVAGLTAAFTALAAIHHRAETGEGQWISISQAEATIALLGDIMTETTLNGRNPKRQGNEEWGFAPHNAYRCNGEDSWIAIEVTDEAGWQGLVQAVGRLDLIEDERFRTVEARWAHRRDLDAIVEGWTVARTASSAVEILQAHGVAAGETETTDRLNVDPQLAAREFWVDDRHPETGPRRMPGIPFRLSSVKRGSRGPAPQLAEGNGYVFGELLGLSPEKVAAFTESQVIF